MMVSTSGQAQIKIGKVLCYSNKVIGCIKFHNNWLESFGDTNANNVHLHKQIYINPKRSIIMIIHHTTFDGNHTMRNSYNQIITDIYSAKYSTIECTSL